MKCSKLGYATLLENCSVFVRKDTTNYRMLLKSLRYLQAQSYLDKTAMEAILYSCAPIYVSKLAETQIEKNFSKAIKKLSRNFIK